MPSPQEDQDPCCSVVEFNLHTEQDDDGGTELLVRAKGHWLYLSVDPEDLATSNDSTASAPLKAEYAKLRDDAARAQKNREAELIGVAHDEAHEENQEPSPKKQKTSASDDSGYQSETIPEDTPEDARNESPSNDTPTADPEQELQNWMLAALTPQFAHLPEIPSTSTKDHPVTLLDWFNAPTRFYTLRSSSNSSSSSSSSSTSKLEAHEHHNLNPSRFRTRTLQHALNIPKDLRNAAPWYSPADVLVCRQTEDVHMALHPTLVCLKPRSPSTRDTEGEREGEGDEDEDENGDEDKELKATHYLKLVPPGPPSATSHPITRELRTLRRLARLSTSRPSLSKTLSFPKLEGLIAPPSTPHSHASITGFLLDLIPNPVPLTQMLSTDVSQAKRESWARQARAMVSALHEVGVCWGDAKADNFLVEGGGGVSALARAGGEEAEEGKEEEEEAEKLWMIDFGGGFTEGWVQEGLCETKEGDREGIAKIEGAVRDPEGATYDPCEAEVDRGEIEGDDVAGEGRKRKR